MASYKGVAECAICCGGSNNQRWSAMECGHVYHQDCLDKWLVHKRDCPNCRVTMGKRKRPLELFLSSVAETTEADVPAVLAERDAQVQELHDSNQQLQEALEAALTAAASAYVAESTLQDKCAQQEERLKDEKQKRESLKCTIADAQTRSIAAAKESNIQLEQYKTHLAQKEAEVRQERVKRQRVQQELTNLRLMANNNMKLEGIQQLLGGGDKLVPAAVLAARNADLQSAHQRYRELEAQLTATKAEAGRQQSLAQEKSRREVEAVEKQRDEAKRGQLRAEVTIGNLQAEKEALKQQLQAAQQERQELQSVVRAVAGPQKVAAARTATAAARVSSSSSGLGMDMPGSSGTDCWSQGGDRLEQAQQHLQHLLQQQQQQQQPWSQVDSERASSNPWAALVPAPAVQRAAYCSTDDDLLETQFQEDEGAMSPPQRQWQEDEGPCASSPFAAPASFLGKASTTSSYFPSTKGSFIRKGPDGMGGTCTHLNVPAAAAANPWASDPGPGVKRPQVQQQLSRQWGAAGAAKKPVKPLAVTKALGKPKAQPITRFFGAGGR